MLFNFLLFFLLYTFYNILNKLSSIWQTKTAFQKAATVQIFYTPINPGQQPNLPTCLPTGSLFLFFFLFIFLLFLFLFILLFW